jgi:hypothetical protein
MATVNKVIKIFRQSAANIATLESEIQDWVSMMDASNYLIQSMAQTTDVVTTYAAVRPDDVDTSYITITFMAIRLPTS